MMPDKMMANATPRPWKTDGDYRHEVIIDGNGKMVADCSIFLLGRTTLMCQANAALIVSAVNSYGQPEVAAVTIEKAPITNSDGAVDLGIYVRKIRRSMARKKLYSRRTP